MKQNFPTKASILLLLALSLVTQRNFSQTPTLQFSGTLETQHEHGVWSRATVTDSNGNFYMTGLYHGTVDFDITSGSFPLTYQGGTAGAIDGEADVYIAKYSTTGALIWVRNLEEPTFVNMNEERGSAMIVDENNNLYLTGFTGTRGFFVSKWNTNGDEIWTRYFDDTEDNFVTTFALRKLGNSVLVSGMFANTVDFNPSSQADSPLTSIANDGFLLALSGSGDFEWVKQFRCNGAVVVSGLEVDDTNNIFLSGTFVGTVDINPSPATSTFFTSESVSFGAFSSAFLAKFSSSGNLIWGKHIQGTAPTDTFQSFIKKDSSNNIIMTYSFKGSATFVNTATTLNTNGFFSSVLAKYNTLGNLIWVKQFGTPTSTQTTFFPSSFTANVILDDCDNIYLSGEFQGNCDFNPATEEKVLNTANNTTDGFVAAYSSEGEHLWSMDVGKTGNMSFVDFNGYLPIALDHNNDLIFTGSFRGEIDVDPSAGETLLLSNSGILSNIAGIFIAKYDNPITVCNLTNTDFEKKKFTVYPNPSKGWVTISTKGIPATATLNIYDISGKRLLSETIKSESSTFDLSHLSKGIYIIELNDNGENFHQKLLIK